MSDTHAACMNFVNALERLPNIIAQHEERTAKLKADVPILQGIVAKQWGKEDELKQLKSDLAALDRKIAAELAPKQENPNDGEEIKRDEHKVVGPQTQSTGEKKSLVAEPTPSTIKTSVNHNLSSSHDLLRVPTTSANPQASAIPASNSNSTGYQPQNLSVAGVFNNLTEQICLYWILL